MNILAIVDFGAGYTGKSVYYRLLNTDKTTAVARTNAGVTEIVDGSGIYGVELNASVVAGKTIVWDINGISAAAVETFDPAEDSGVVIRAALGMAAANLDSQLSTKPTAQNVWEHGSRSLTDKTGFAPTTGDIRAALGPELARIDQNVSAAKSLTGDYDAAKTAASQSSIDALASRINMAVPSGPVHTMPTPSVSQTVVWALCVSKTGSVQSGVSVTLRQLGVGYASSGAFEQSTQTATSGSDGLVTFTIPRITGARFAVRRGHGEWVPFTSVDAETLQLPAMIG